MPGAAGVFLAQRRGCAGGQARPRCRAATARDCATIRSPSARRPVVEAGGQLAGDRGAFGGCPLRPCHVVPQVGQREAPQAAVQDAGDGPGAVHWGGGDLVDEGADVVPGELGGAELVLQGLPGVLALVPPGFGFGEPGLDLLVDVRVQGLPGRRRTTG